jgi:hypothetical protein
MPDETLEQEIAELTARIATAEEELRQFRQDISRRASRNAPIYDDLIRAAEMQRLQDQRKELLEALERRRTDV